MKSPSWHLGRGPLSGGRTWHIPSLFCSLPLGLLIYAKGNPRSPPLFTRLCITCLLKPSNQGSHHNLSLLQGQCLLGRALNLVGIFLPQSLDAVTASWDNLWPAHKNSLHLCSRLAYPRASISFYPLPWSISVYDLHNLLTFMFCCCSVTQSCLTLCNSMDCSAPGFPVLHNLLKLAQTHIHWVGDVCHCFSPPGKLHKSRDFVSVSALSQDQEQCFTHGGSSVKM